MDFVTVHRLDTSANFLTLLAGTHLIMVNVYDLSRRLIFALLIIIGQESYSQELRIEVYHENAQDGSIVLYCNNDEYHPVSLLIEPQVSNMAIDKEFADPAVVPGRSQRTPVARLIPQKGKSWKFSYRFTAHPGDISDTLADITFIYALPYPGHKKYLVSQGYDGKISHQNTNALDFDMPENSEVLAIREGVVTHVIDTHKKSCPDPSCNQYNNMVRIMHPDGTFAEYAHLRYKGSLVKPGQMVKTGEPIARSGNTGWTTGPHLHLAIWRSTARGRMTLKTRFRLRDESTTYLKEGHFY